MKINSFFLADFYKFGHKFQYPKDTRWVCSNWTPRSTRIPGVTHMQFVGLQFFIKEYLQQHFRENFFSIPLETILKEYKEVIGATLGIPDPPADHVEWLHRKQYLPIVIFSVPEGSAVPIGVPAMVIANTAPEAFWLPNFLETILSNILWVPSTSATTAKRYRKIFEKYALQAGETDLGFVNYMGHDFSFRGMGGLEDAVLSGLGHLTQFSGTDTLPAIIAAHDYYGAPYTVGGSVPATEHSVMCAGTKEGEFETFRHMIEDVYPSGIVSIVSDSWDHWTVLTDYLPRLKDKILARNGKVVIRPDSGDPVKIICGNEDAGGLGNSGYNTDVHPAFYGTAHLLASVFPVERTTEKGYKTLKNVGMIYGDAITPERAEAILQGLIQQKLSPYNMVFGIGSYTYRYVTRDTMGLAMKATAVDRGGVIIPIFKLPVTDDGGKKSLKGIPIVRQRDDGEYFVETSVNPDDLNHCAFEKVFENGNLLIETTFDEIRKRARK